MTMIYNDPNASPSSISASSTSGEQFNTFKWHKKALVEIRNHQFFGQLANVRAMPKHMGKTIKQYRYIPVLDDRNINDQGIDAAGVVIVSDGWVVRNPDGTYIGGATEVAATVYADEATAVAAADLAGVGGAAYEKSGNLYGSSKDVGLITAKMPALSETGGKVNRIGFTRLTIEGSIVKQGFYSDYTKESMDFDTDSELMSHIVTESLVAANEMTEDSIQIDLLNGAGVTRYGGVATSNATITGEGGDPSVLDYPTLMRLSIDLDNNKCPKSTKMITGSRMIDTRVVNSARYVYCGSEMLPTLMAMTDYHGNPAWKSVETYAQAGNIAMGEAGAIGQFRFIIVPEMMRWQGAGATVTTNPGYLATGDKYDVCPLLVVGSDSFATIGFQTDGKTVKFKIIHRPPESGKDSNDPFEETGTYAIKWYYGSMILRSEWIAVVKVVGSI